MTFSSCAFGSCVFKIVLVQISYLSKPSSANWKGEPGANSWPALRIFLFYLTTVSFTALFNVAEGVVTVTYPVVAPVGTVAVR